MEVIRLDVRVSIGVCVKDSEKIIGGALRSIFAQDFPHNSMELIIVDDGSTDRTLSIVKDLALETDIDTHIYHHTWKGLAFSRQVVVDNARGKYLVWVDSDYILPNDFISKHVDFMESNPEIGVSSGQEILRGDTLVAFLESISTLPDDPKQVNVVDVGGAIYRIEVVKEVGGFDKDLKAAGEDVDLTNRIKETRWKLAKSPAQFYHGHRKTWKTLWSEYLWWGYGMHYVAHKHGHRFVMVNIPLIAMTFAIKKALKLYKRTRRRGTFLLPLHSFLKYTAWCLGFLESHIDQHGH